MYTNTWKKYLPVIRLLLKRSATGEQSIKLSRIDFEKNNRLRKPVVSFSVEIIRSRISTTNPSVPAKDLLEVLQLDEVTKVLLRQHQYKITLDSDFTLGIVNITPAPTEEAS